MDKLKIKIDLMNADRAADELEKAIAAYDHKQIGAQLYRLRQALQNMRRELDPGQSEAQPLEKIYTCPTCGAHHEDGGRGKPPVYCDECGADWPA